MMKCFVQGLLWWWVYGYMWSLSTDHFSQLKLLWGCWCIKKSVFGGKGVSGCKKKGWCLALSQDFFSFHNHMSQFLKVNESFSHISPSQYIFVVVVQSLSLVQLFVAPGISACQASLSLAISWSLLKLMSIESMMPSNHLILCRLLLLLPSIFPSIRIFSSESAPRTLVAKVLELHFQHQSFQWQFRIDLLYT